MKYKVDHGCHIHSYLSLCGGDAHRPDELDRSGAELCRMVELFEVEESEKFYITRTNKDSYV